MLAWLSLPVVCGVVLSFSVAAAEPVVLESVPPTGWDRPYVPVQMLQVALGTMGCKRGYDELMVTSGAAFRMTWREGDYNFPSLTLYQQDPISVGAVGVGAQVTREQFNDLEAAFAAIADSIDRGAPVIAWDDGRVDMQVICGYDAATTTIFRRTINAPGGVFDQVPAEKIRAMPWAGATYELWLLDLPETEDIPPLDWPLILANALRLAQWPEDQLVYDRFTCGDAAYLAWAMDMRDPDVHPKFPRAGGLAWALASHMQHARWTAARVLQNNAVVHPAVVEAGLLYQDEATIFGEVQRVLCGGAALPKTEAVDVANELIADEEVRLAAAGLVEQALEKDRAARLALTRALEDLAPELLPRTDDEPGDQ